MWCSLPLVALSAATAAASYAGNLNYRSPSLNHPGLGISIPKVAKRGSPSAPYDPSRLNFTHGVASGDPYATSVILWTRCAPKFDNSHNDSATSGLVPLYNPVPIYSGDDEHVPPPSHAPVCLTFKVATDRSFKDVVDSGTLFTSSDVDYTAKVEATQLQPFTTYYYQFQVCNSNITSPIGRTKTAPAPTDDVSEIGLAVYSCSNYRMLPQWPGNSLSRD